MVTRPGRDGADAWPAWYAPLGFALALALTAVAGSLLAALAAALSSKDPSELPGVAIAATLAQNVALVGVAVLLAARTGAVRTRDFGLRRVPLGTAVKWTAASLGIFYAIGAAYALLVDPGGEQEVLETLGADDSRGLAIVAAVMVIGLAPVVEEVFFRGFFYRALRNRFSTAVAAAIVGLIFGALHYSGPETLSLLPVLALLGVLFCLLYERTGSLYPAIVLHVINNTAAVVAGIDDQAAAAAGIVLATAMIAGTAAAAGRSKA